MSRPTASEALALPVVRYRPTGVGLMTTDDDGPWCRFVIAQAALDKLTAERDTQRASLDALVDLTSDTADQLRKERDEARAHFAQVCEQYDAMAGEFSALKTSPAVNVDEAMRLADEMVIAKATAEHANQYGSLSKWKLWTEAYDAAREALRAYLGGKS